ncbi:diguanylate cyclase [Catenulispora acidiphila DSM 44928]|uniref:Diguanylate cyclase n=1 Tax=Catenulispora acidiphila (strain DSM 44928 / JCM 14897 / NBRC 102108 / NRRL B-24433 / ID139908) TaxID=479433 RepID=C7QER9_CATAD|nr:GGDEF domain-containing protein [Catenulispora acidiphila]ACU72839.1 diguanylate cyclase [Catenulispora acidiphila DSM 44928]
MGRIGGGLLLAGSLLVAGVTLLSYMRDRDLPPPDSRPISLILCLPAVIVGVFLVLSRASVPGWLVNIAPGLAAVLICIPTVVDGRPGPLGPVLLTWTVVYSAYMLAIHVAWMTMGVVAASFAAAAFASRGVDGTDLWIAVTSAILVVFMLVIRLRSQSDRLSAQLIALARADPLTGLVNHRGFEEALGRAQVRHSRDGRPVSLLAIDIDRFKDVNDTWGHPAGDAVLQELAKLLAAYFRSGDVIARVGGEEFAVLISDCGVHEALRRAQGLLGRVREDSLTWDHRITVSIGVATVPDQVEDFDGLHRSADRALYRAKKAGRDGVVSANSGNLVTGSDEADAGRRNPLVR